jgi:poly-gamma-glutamate capsule biosynthesis protein CapA/YwtB (metallophosphatase superfamily)
MGKMKNIRSILSFIFCMGSMSFIQTQQTKTIRIGFMGDVMLGRLVNEVINQTSYAYPWGNVRPLLYQNDLNIANLETTLTNSATPVPKVFNFKATPDKVQTLVEGNIHVVNLANNHILDFGVEGMKETVETLDKAGIKHVGAGNNLAEAQRPAIIERNGISIGILGYTDNEPGWAAEPDKPGINYIKVGDLEPIQQAIQKLKSQVDLIIISIHWGPNWPERPPQKLIDFAHAILDSGADIIHGHSPHILQPLEIYKNKLIMYGTGDFIDDYHVDPLRRNDRSALFLVTIDKREIHKVQLIPVIIKAFQVNQAQGEDYEAVIKRLQSLSEERNTFISDNGEIIMPSSKF